jgi:hypothetical protein
MSHFRLHGEFTGFIRTREGKKRMVLQVAGEAMQLKVERGLRRELSGRLSPGTMLEVTGEVRTELFTGEMKRVVTKVHARTGAATACTIKVCAKKNCWRQGGKELWRGLEAEVKSRGLEETVRLKAVNCLDECKHAPNLECDGRVHRQCSPAQATALLAGLAEGLEESAD